jgi:hypothetical protein
VIRPLGESTTSSSSVNIETSFQLNNSKVYWLMAHKQIFHS